jgi:hypothetical protein
VTEPDPFTDISLDGGCALHYLAASGWSARRGEIMTPNALQLSALSRLFSSSVFREMAKKGRSSLFARLIGQTGIEARFSHGTTVGDAFDLAFSVLCRSGLRDEYVYRAALTHNVLLGTHSLNTASMLSEFRAGACKADLVILNGTATVYEIKSERDSLARLANQVANYKKVFAKVYVVAGESHVRDVLEETPADVGVMCLSRRHSISTVREAADRLDRVCPETIFDSLRSAEARAILLDLKVPVPDVPNTMLHPALRACFERLKPEDVHRAMVKTLKLSRDLAPLGKLVDQLPSSLQPAALSIQVRRADHDRLVDAVRTLLGAATAWA